MSKLNNKKNEFSFLEKHRKKLNVGMSILLILLGLNYFPINLSNLSLIEILRKIFFGYSIMLLGRIYKTINQQDVSKTFLYAFSFNLLGLIIMIALEYGETSFYKALTLPNMVIQISLIPILFTIGSLFKKMKLIKDE